MSKIRSSAMFFSSGISASTLIKTLIKLTSSYFRIYFNWFSSVWGDNAIIIL